MAPSVRVCSTVSASAMRFPRVFYTNSSWEYWRGDASLLHVDPAGERDLEPEPTTRIYAFAGTQHVPGVVPLIREFPATGERARHPLNCVDFSPLVRAALVNLDRWVSEGVEPPASSYPRIADGTAVTRASVLERFRGLPGIHPPDPERLSVLRSLDLGPEQERGVGRYPAREGERYPALVSQVDAEGNEIAGIRARAKQRSSPLSGGALREPRGLPGARSQAGARARRPGLPAGRRRGAGGRELRPPLRCRARGGQRRRARLSSPAPWAGAGRTPERAPVILAAEDTVDLQPIRFEAPRSLDEAVRLLAGDPEHARVLAGGTDLLVQMRTGRLRPELIVDIKRIPELTRVRMSGGSLEIGAAASALRVRDLPEVRENYPGLAEAINLIGSEQIQGRASVGGNLCNGSPAADTTPALIAIGARCIVQGPQGTREIKVEDFVVSPGRTALRAGELLVKLVIPAAQGGKDAYLRLIPRTEMDIAVVGAGVRVKLERDGSCREARVALGAVAPTPILVPDAAAALVGRRIDDASLARAAAAASAACVPIDDKRGTIEYRRKVAGVLTRRAATIAAQRAAERAA